VGQWRVIEKAHAAALAAPPPPPRPQEHR
jgi:hypothetical protein